MSADGDKPIPLTSLSIEELNRIRTRTEEVCSFITNQQEKSERERIVDFFLSFFCVCVALLERECVCVWGASACLAWMAGVQTRL